MGLPCSPVDTCKWSVLAALLECSGGAEQISWLWWCVVKRTPGQMSSKSLLFLSMGSTVSAPHLLAPPECPLRSSCLCCYPMFGVPASCLGSPGQVQGLTEVWVQALPVRGPCTAPLLFPFFLRLPSSFQLSLGPQTHVHVPWNVLGSRAVATDWS